MKKTMKYAVLAALFLTPAVATAGVSADLQALQAANTALQGVAQTWPQLQSQAQAYGALANYASQSGKGPIVRVPGLEFEEQCHNVHWDNEIDQLVTGGLNIAGDAEAESYALEILSVQWDEDATNLMEAEVSRQAPSDVTQLQSELAESEQSGRALSALLNGLGSQISAAMGPNSGFTPLPIRNWQAGMGSYPDLTAVQWISGPSDGAPIGWAGNLLPTQGIARLVDVCPTGSANIPEISDAPILSGIQQAVTDEPSMSTVLQSVEGGSTWSLPTATSFFSSPYTTRMNLVAALGSDLPQVANYLAPVTPDVAQFASIANQVTQQMASGG